MSLPTGIAAVLAAAGVVQTISGYLAVRSFAPRMAPAGPPLDPASPGPGVTVLKPLYGDEPLLEAALNSTCTQSHRPLQVVLGAQDPADPALAVAARVRARFPDVDIEIVVDNTADGPNRKIANLINMLPSARHGILVIADSDLHPAPDWIARIVQTLAQPGTGLVTNVYAGLAATPGLVGRLGASWITHTFLPGALLGRKTKRQDCLGATMALRRDVLERVGGLASLLSHLADDHVLGRKVIDLGLAVQLAPTVPATTVPETTLAALFSHELRWGRTIRTIAPTAFALSAVQHPLGWALMDVLLSGGASWAIALLLAVWLVRGAAAWGIDSILGLARGGRATPVPFLLLPLRDVMSLAVILASYASDDVTWRGRPMRATGLADLQAR